MRIVHITPELTPIAKVGGLGDVTQGLCKALMKEKENVEIILPFYDHIDKKKLKNLTIFMDKLSSYEDMGECENTVWSAEIDGLSVFLIQPHHAYKYFERGKIYGEDDDIDRFIYFSRAALEFLLKKGDHIDVVNLHDWITGLCAPIYKELYASLGLQIGGIMTTIHNMCYQGVCKPEALARIGLKPENFHTQDKMQDHKKPERLNLLKGAIAYSDSLTTVSPTYAEEIKQEHGFGLEPFLFKHESKLRGILNGIDTEFWNPEIDPHLKVTYPSDFTQLKTILDAKKANRKALSNKVHLEYDPGPLFACISRLVKQKGPELIRFGIEYVLQKGGQFVLLGSTPETDLKTEFQELKEEYRDNPHVHFFFGFDETLAHLTFSAADAILVPSLFEPCGLTQMIALRYGAIPIVHKVGGLKDTIFDIDHNELPKEKRNGYTFDYPSTDSLRWSIDRAIEHLTNDLDKWHLMLKNGFTHDWSWKASALEYLELYHAISNKVST